MRHRTHMIAAVAALAIAAVPAGASLADGSQQSDIYGFTDFYGIPRLGTETVPGSGCGGDGSIGDVVPDGYWRGFVTNVADPDALQIDLVCVYGPNVDPDLVTEWQAAHPGEPLPWVPDGFMVNNNPRLRNVPKAPGFVAHGAAWDATTCRLDDESTAFLPSRDAWIRIVGGQVQWAVSSCDPDTSTMPPGWTETGGSVGTTPSGPEGYSFPYPSFYDVPRLGHEEVLGSGCGADGSIGDTLPDGIWFGWIHSLGATSMEFDVTCIYIGETAARLQAEWEANPEQQLLDPSPYFWGGMWLSDTSAQVRTVPLAPTYVTAMSDAAFPDDPDPNWPPHPDGIAACVAPVDPTIWPDNLDESMVTRTGAWVQITNGQAQYALLECQHD